MNLYNISLYTSRTQENIIIINFEKIHNENVNQITKITLFLLLNNRRKTKLKINPPISSTFDDIQ